MSKEEQPSCLNILIYKYVFLNVNLFIWCQSVRSFLKVGDVQCYTTAVVGLLFCVVEMFKNIRRKQRKIFYSNKECLRPGEMKLNLSVVATFCFCSRQIQPHRASVGIMCYCCDHHVNECLVVFFLKDIDNSEYFC